MRAECQDGVTIANGALYWWPMSCDCQLNIYGVTSLGPARDFNFYPTASTDDRLEQGPAYDRQIYAGTPSPADWPTFRANNIATASQESS